MNHRESWAEERKAPSHAAWQTELRREAAKAPRTRGAGAVVRRQEISKPTSQSLSSVVVRREGDRSLTGSPASNTEIPASRELSEDFPVDVLVIASKLKEYIRARSGMNTSDSVLGVLSDRLRTLCDGAIRSAHNAERKTVLDRDFSR